MGRLTAWLNSGAASVATGGSARFATTKEMAAFRDPPESGAWIFGETDSRWWKHQVSVKDDRPVLVFGPTRSDKNRALGIQNTLSYPGSLVSIDPKGETALITARMRARKGQKVRLLDPFGICAKKRGGKPLGCESSFDPLSMIDRNNEDAAEDIKALVDAMVLDDSEYWSGLTKRFIGGMFARFKLFPQEQPMSLLFAIMNKPDKDMEDYIRLIENGLHDGDPLADMFRTGAKAYLERDARGRGILRQCVEDALSIFSGPAMRRVMKPGGWSFEDVQRKPTSVYIVLPTDKLTSHAAWLRVMTFCAMTGMARAPKPKHQTLVILDEFANLGRMEMIKSGISYASGQGMKLVVMVQDVGQIQEHYKESWSTFLANAGAMVVLGANDPGTRDIISSMLGQAKMIRRATSMAELEIDRQTEQTVPLMTPAEVGIFCARETGKMLVLLQGRPPMRINRQRYDEVLLAGVDYDVHPDHMVKGTQNVTVRGKRVVAAGAGVAGRTAAGSGGPKDVRDGNDRQRAAAA